MFVTYDYAAGKCAGFKTCEQTSSELCATCVSRQKNCPSAPWVMAVGGYYRYRRNTTELVSLDPVRHPVPECLKTLQPYPYGVNSANGGTVRGV